MDNISEDAKLSKRSVVGRRIGIARINKMKVTKKIKCSVQRLPLNLRNTLKTVLLIYSSSYDIRIETAIVMSKFYFKFVSINTLAV